MRRPTLTTSHEFRAKRRIARLNKEVCAILASPEARAIFEAQGLVPATSTPQTLGEIVARDRKRWADVVARRGIQPE